MLAAESGVSWDVHEGLEFPIDSMRPWPNNTFSTCYKLQLSKTWRFVLYSPGVVPGAMCHHHLPPPPPDLVSPHNLHDPVIPAGLGHYSTCPLSPVRVSSLSSPAGRPATLDRKAVRFSGHHQPDTLEPPQGPIDGQQADYSPSFPPPPPPLAIATFNYAALCPQL